MLSPNFFLLLLPLTVICSSCGGVVSVPPPPITISVMPGSAQPFAGAGVQFNAVVQNAASSAVSWLVNAAPGGNATVGTIDSTGFYSAPDSVPSPPTVTVTAILQIDPAMTGSSNVTIQSDSAIQGPILISPALSSLTTSQTLQLHAQASGVQNLPVTWAVDGIRNGNAATGAISAAGLYSPPASVGIHLITAILIANPNATGRAQVDVTDFRGTLTWRNDNARSGVNNQELALSPTTVNSAAFGKLFSCPLDGDAYVQPLYVPNLAIPGNGTHNVVFVATEKDSVYAFDADANPCVQLWPTKISLIPAESEAIPTPNMDITSTDIVPSIGITGTPVIDLDLSNLYVVAKTRTVTGGPSYSQRLYALDLATGQPKILSTGVQISTFGAPTSVFSPVLENQRPALLLDNGIVYIAFGSHGGQEPYNGWLLGYDANTLQQTGAFSVTPESTGGGIWQSGGGPAADLNHNVFVLTGDGPFNVGNGVPSYGNSALRLDTTGAFFAADYFSPCDQATLGSRDFGAGAPLLLPDSAGSASDPHWMVGASKNGSLYLMNRDTLGGYDPNCQADSLPRVQTVPVGDGPVPSTPLFWNGALYVAAGNGKLKSFPMLGGVLGSSASSSQSPETLGPQGATPAISSNGANGAILWVIDSSGALATPIAPAILRAYDPADLSKELYHSAMVASRDTAGPAVKFTVPTIANGKVYVGTQTELDVYGLLP